MNGISPVSNQLAQIANTLEGVSAYTSVSLSASSQECTISTMSKNIPQLFEDEVYALLEKGKSYLTEVFSKTFNITIPSSKIHHSTTEYFSKIFGKKRLEQIARRAGVSLTCKATLGQEMTKSDLERLFAQSAEIYHEDLVDLFQEIKTTTGPIRFLSQEESDDIRKQFRCNNSLDDCTNEALNTLFSILIPFENIQHIFLNRAPKFDLPCLDSGQTFLGLQERVYIYEHMRRNTFSDSAWMMKMAKKLADREIPKDVVFPSPKGGFLKVHETVHGGGAFIYFLKHIGNKASDENNMLFCRGTRGIPTATGWLFSLVEDLRFELGGHGPQKTYEKVKALVTDPALGFIKEQQDTIAGYGMSLGGAHIARIAVLLKGKLNNVHIIAGPGIDEDTAQIFKDWRQSDQETHFRIHHWIEADDIVDQFGDVMLGHECDPKHTEVHVHIVTPSNPPEHNELSLEEQLREIGKKRIFPEPPFSYAKAIHVFLNALLGPHIRNTLEKERTITHLSNESHPEIVKQILGHTGPLYDKRWEEMRKLVAIDKNLLSSGTSFYNLAKEQVFLDSKEKQVITS